MKKERFKTLDRKLFFKLENFITTQLCERLYQQKSITIFKFIFKKLMFEAYDTHIRILVKIQICKYEIKVLRD